MQDIRSIHKNLLYSYIIKKMETEIKRNTTTIAAKKRNYLGINLTMYMENLYLKKEIDENLNKWRNESYWWTGKFNTA